MNREHALTIIILFAFVSFGYLTLKYFKAVQWNRIIAEKNAECAALSHQTDELGLQCDCYYGECSTENEKIDGLSESYCMCDCVVNGSTKTICARKSF